MKKSFKVGVLAKATPARRVRHSKSARELPARHALQPFFGQNKVGKVANRHRVNQLDKYKRHHRTRRGNVRNEQNQRLVRSGDKHRHNRTRAYKAPVVQLSRHNGKTALRNKPRSRADERSKVSL